MQLHDCQRVGQHHGDLVPHAHPLGGQGHRSGAAPLVEPAVGEHPPGFAAGAEGDDGGLVRRLARRHGQELPSVPGLPRAQRSSAARSSGAPERMPRAVRPQRLHRLDPPGGG